MFSLCEPTLIVTNDTLCRINLFLWQAVCFIRKAHQAKSSRRTHVILISDSCLLLWIYDKKL